MIQVQAASKSYLQITILSSVPSLTESADGSPWGRSTCSKFQRSASWLASSPHSPEAIIALALSVESAPVAGGLPVFAALEHYGTAPQECGPYISNGVCMGGDVSRLTCEWLTTLTL